MKICIKKIDLIDLVSYIKQMPTGYIEIMDNYLEFHNPVGNFHKIWEVEVHK